MRWLKMRGQLVRWEVHGLWSQTLTVQSPALKLDDQVCWDLVKLPPRVVLLP